MWAGVGVAVAFGVGSIVAPVGAAPPPGGYSAAEVADFLRLASFDRIAPADGTSTLRHEDPTGDTFPYVGPGVPDAPPWVDLVGGGGYRIEAADPGLRQLLDQALLPLCTSGDPDAVCPDALDTTAFDDGITVFWGDLAGPIAPAGGLLTYVAVAGSDGESPGLDPGPSQPNSPFAGATVFYNYEIGSKFLQVLEFGGGLVGEIETSAVVLTSTDAVVFVIPSTELDVVDFDVSADVVSGVTAATGDTLKPLGGDRFTLPAAVFDVVLDGPLLAPPADEPTVTEPPATTEAPATTTDDPGTTEPAATAPDDTDDPSPTTEGTVVTAAPEDDGEDDQGDEDDGGSSAPWFIAGAILLVGGGAAAFAFARARRAGSTSR